MAPPNKTDSDPAPATDSQSELPRSLEPEAMDDAAEVREYQRMDHRAVNQRFVDDLRSGGAVGPRVTDLGCGTGDILVLLCQQDDTLEGLGIDCSVEMLEAARLEIELGSVTGRVQLEHADCKSLEGFEAGTADTVISNTMLHHLAEPSLAVERGIHLLKPGGRLFLRDLMRPPTAERVEALVAEHAGGESEYAQQLLRQSLHAALTLDEARRMATALGIPAACVQPTSDRHWTLDWQRPLDGST
jgi:ubiquinone/menaquinone biosynthesis C-methylase UbiE